MASKPPERVVVVGAGLAGLTAAYELSKHEGTQVSLLEARDRVGGRVQSVDLHGIPVDLGGFLIFPWYAAYRALCSELGIQDDLQHVPALGMYYELGDGKLLTAADFELQLRSLVTLVAKSLPGAFLAGSLDHPKLDFYAHRSIAECLDLWVPVETEAAKYKLMVDTLCQGYGYASIDRYKAAFAAPIYPRSLLAGDAQASDIFRHGAQELVFALRDAFLRQGGKIILDCEVLGFDGAALRTSGGLHEADAFVFAMNADHALFRDLVPPATRSIAYTAFLTAVFQLDRAYHAETPDWGAIFFTPKHPTQPQILSMIDVARLYGAPALENYYTVNVRLDDATVDPVQVLHECIASLHPEMGRVLSIAASAVWQQTMPISSEDVVETVRALQGINRCYFAGDYLGCPSMEVAVKTGQSAARLVFDGSSG